VFPFFPGAPVSVLSPQKTHFPFASALASAFIFGENALPAPGPPGILYALDGLLRDAKSRKTYAR
jgi:hypothetical protein